MPDGANLQLVVKDFESCRNVAQGAVFIVASGNSAKDFPVEQFADVPMITMNGAISMFLDTEIQPYFYVCSDTNFRIQQPHLYEVAVKCSQRMAIWETEVGNLSASPAGEVYLLKKAPDLSFLGSVFKRESHHARSWALWDKRARSIGFSKNLQHGYFDARTVAYLALQLAYHLGFSKVFLVGVDMNQTVGRFYENNASFISPCGLNEHFESRILPSLKLMATDVVSKEFTVYNLSSPSRIPHSVIPKISIAQVRTMLNQA